MNTMQTNPQDILKTLSLSFEVFPPKKWEDFPGLYETLDELKGLHPEFISCTYGAGGSNSKKTAEIASHIENELGIRSIAHLTCAALTEDKLLSTIENFKNAGIHSVLALRGDKPFDMSEEDFANRQYKHPSEIIPILKKAGFRVAAACYPEKHYEAPSMEEDLHWLKHKVEQGADALISQLFFDNDAFYRFMDAADQKGITVPVHAGIMPITSAKMINTTINLSGASIPKALSDLIATYGENPSDMRKAGIEYAARQINDLAEQGMHYVHIYTMNHSETAKEICALIKQEFAAGKIDAPEESHSPYICDFSRGDLDVNRQANIQPAATKVTNIDSFILGVRQLCQPCLRQIRISSLVGIDFNAPFRVVTIAAAALLIFNISASSSSERL